MAIFFASIMRVFQTNLPGQFENISGTKYWFFRTGTPHKYIVKSHLFLSNALGQKPTCYQSEVSKKI